MEIADFLLKTLFRYDDPDRRINRFINHLRNKGIKKVNLYIDKISEQGFIEPHITHNFYDLNIKTNSINFKVRRYFTSTRAEREMKKVEEKLKNKGIEAQVLEFSEKI